MLRIGDFSKLSRISIRMLRHYDEIGLLSPDNIDNFTKYRYYSLAQLPVANRITSLKDMGFKLTAIVDILSSYNTPDMLLQFLLIRQKELTAQSEDTKQRLRLLEYTISRIKEDDKTMNYNVTLKTLEQRQVASVRKTIPAYTNEGMLWGMLMQETAPLNIKGDATTCAIAIFHDREHKECDVDVEVQLTVKGSYPNTENVVFKTECAVQIASATYKGSYEKISEVNECVSNWVETNGYEFNGTAFNIYHVSPQETQNPDEFVTEVCYPVKKK